MLTFDELTLSIIFLLIGVGIGVGFGMYYENQFGERAKEAKKFHNTIMRMIPKLREHYTDDYIYWELLRGSDDDNNTATRRTDT